jgi:hypothetical protein
MGFVIYKVALGEGFTDYFSFVCQNHSTSAACLLNYRQRFVGHKFRALLNRAHRKSRLCVQASAQALWNILGHKFWYFISYRKIQQDATVYENLLSYIYVKLNMFWATHRPSSGD